MSTEPYIGQISMTAFAFAPRGWALCNGQPMSIAQNQALFSLIGIAYGGNGQTTFNLPNLMGRVPMHQGQGPGLSPRTMGMTAGSESVTLLVNQLPAHNHFVNVTSNDSTAKNPSGAYLGGTASPTYAATPNTQLNPAAITATGSSLPHDNMQPFQVVSFIIALEGIFPSRN